MSFEKVWMLFVNLPCASEKTIILDFKKLNHVFACFIYILNSFYVLEVEQQQK